ncbi:MAG: metallophosphoesterase [Bacteroidales bacterium]|nr:metallophosphoesterase [Bacteroidales bacterium]MBN2761789.1 metallophosphoesterase [Bacteroidales bacterium]
MIIVALTDLHGRINIISRFEPVLSRADLVLLIGDNTHFGHYAEMEAVIQTIRSFNKNLFAVSGNCDYPDAEQYLIERGFNINRCLKEFQGLYIAGLSGSLPCPGKTPNEHSEEDFRFYLEAMKPDIKHPFILATHQPPFKTLNDRVLLGFHVGSKVIRKFIGDCSPLVCFTGHIHEGKGIDSVGSAKIVNPGPARDGHYASLILEDGDIKDLRIDRV